MDNSILNKVITLNDSIVFLATDCNPHCDSLCFKSEFHFIIMVNASCDACLSEIWDWKIFVDKHPEFEPLEFHFLLYGEKYTLPGWIKYETGMKNFFFWNDPASLFTKEYGIKQDPILNIFLLDENNKVLFVGNPTKSDQLYEKIIRIIFNIS
ncbi:MAG TPA: hypothetical protein P5132_04910 [Bacteroidales bacterium]|nr:hypothetical protein [Bacteroidales bacterium]